MSRPGSDLPMFASGACEAQRLITNSEVPGLLAFNSAAVARFASPAIKTLLVLSSTPTSPSNGAANAATGSHCARTNVLRAGGARDASAPHVSLACSALVSDRELRWRTWRKQLSLLQWRPRCLRKKSVRPEALRPRLSASLPLALQEGSSAGTLYKSSDRVSFRRREISATGCVRVPN